MATKVDIINAAFLLLGAHAVNNLGDNAPDEVKKCIALYNIYYPALLTDYQWRFSIKQFQLALSSGAPTIVGYQYAYQIPNDVLSIYSLYPSNNYQIYGDLLYCNLGGPVFLYYMAYVPESMLPEYYIRYLIEKFAEIFAMPLTQDKELLELWGQSAELALNKAIALDGQSQPSLTLRYNPLGEAKYSGSWFGYDGNGCP